MNDFGARKLGEVLAFSRAGTEIMDKGKEALKDIFDLESLKTDFSEQGKRITEVAERYQVLAKTEAKAEMTHEKLLNIAQMYIGDDWDDTAEVLEWLGFFQGAALIHWNLVSGTAGALEDQELLDLCDESTRFNRELLEKIEDDISKYAQGKANT